MGRSASISFFSCRVPLNLALTGDLLLGFLRGGVGLEQVAQHQARVRPPQDFILGRGVPRVDGDVLAALPLLDVPRSLVSTVDGQLPRPPLLLLPAGPGPDLVEDLGAVRPPHHGAPLQRLLEQLPLLCRIGAPLVHTGRSQAGTASTLRAAVGVRDLDGSPAHELRLAAGRDMEREVEVPGGRRDECY